MSDARPFCECGNCNSTGRPSGPGGEPTLPEIRLPMAAWAVAGPGDHHRLAVLPAHAAAFDDDHHVLERHRGWVAVAAVDAPEPSRL